MILLNGDYAILMMFHYFVINIIDGLQVDNFNINIYEYMYIHSYKWDFTECIYNMSTQIDSNGISIQPKVGSNGIYIHVWV